ncbi:MAG: ABC transporter permease [Candidatus Aminicenantes bacterium]|nr:ABC transporter permease [Candidatus Aminicenantes bacterium]
MLKSYFLTAIRNIKRQKTYSLIIIIGLAVGMAGFALFALTAGTKLNSDKFHKDAGRIFTLVQVTQVDNKDERHSAFLPAPLISDLNKEFPEVEDAVRIFPVPRLSVKRNKNSFIEEGILFVDPNFFSFFSFSLASGDSQTALAKPYSMVISEAAAEKYFGTEDPIGKVLTLDNRVDVTVTGIARTVPRTSSIRFDILVSMETSRILFGLLDDWKESRHTGFWKLPKGMKKDQLETRFPSVIDKYYSDPDRAPERMYLFSLLDVRLKGDHIASPMASSNMAGVFILFFVGILLLLVVSVNFINLSTTRYMHRLREIGMRKVIGARRSQLIRQFLGEAILLAVLALPVAIVLYEFISPIFTSYIGVGSNISRSIFQYPFLLKYLVAAALLTGFFSGIYPAFFVSSFRPTQVLKGSFKPGRKRRRGSRAMIVFQFSVSIILIILAGTMKDQFKVLLNADLGYDRSRVAVVEIPVDAGSKRELLQSEILRHPKVLAVSASASLPVVWDSPGLVRPPDKPEADALTMEAYGVDYDFVEVLGIKTLKGRSFAREYDDRNSFILGETAVKRLQWEDPLGKELVVGDKKGRVVGVTGDFLFGDIGFEIPPAVLYLEQQNLNTMLVKLSSEDSFSEVRRLIKELWLIHAPEFPFECQTLETHFSTFFDLLSNIAGFLNIIGILAVFFSCLGLLGLTSYMVERRTKEIGVRKILGASLFQINWSILKEFIFLVAIANIIALGLIYFGWNRVLQTGLLYLEKISAWTYAFAVFVSLFMAFFAVVSQTFKAARANPVSSLRYE